MSIDGSVGEVVDIYAALFGAALTTTKCVEEPLVIHGTAEPLDELNRRLNIGQGFAGFTCGQVDQLLAYGREQLQDDLRATNLRVRHA